MMITRSGHVVALRIMAYAIYDCDIIILQRANIRNAQNKLSERQFIW
jgi:hypothetical protein